MVFLLVLAAIALYFCYVIARPFLAPVFLALMIAIVFHPIHVRIESRIQRRNLAGLTSTILVVVTVFVPTFILGVLATREAHALYIQLSQRSAEQGGWNAQLHHPSLTRTCNESTEWKDKWLSNQRGKWPIERTPRGACGREQSTSMFQRSFCRQTSPLPATGLGNSS